MRGESFLEDAHLLVAAVVGDRMRACENSRRAPFVLLVGEGGWARRELGSVALMDHLLFVAACAQASQARTPSGMNSAAVRKKADATMRHRREPLGRGTGERHYLPRIGRAAMHAKRHCRLRSVEGAEKRCSLLSGWPLEP
ncbi:hypothetical protein HPB50_022206 [Hyalomma asiaticum]|uniref:Uncharacterized protein n=1 Tax=Hyalomma asiaticum TaxID=266040 RepID=A0ACB7S814_HYAAI|nr:hypothetical protein HPB50_022206 [Hyalomma asiaticum]